MRVIKRDKTGFPQMTKPDINYLQMHHKELQFGLIYGMEKWVHTLYIVSQHFFPVHNKWTLQIDIPHFDNALYCRKSPNHCNFNIFVVLECK